MTNREIIERLKELGFEDRTEPEYWTYPTYGGTMRQRLQDEVLDFVKDYDDNTITIGVTNDRWSFNGLTDDDNVTNGEAVWLNHDCDNEDLIRTEGAIVSIDEDGDSLIFTVRKRNRNTWNTYKQEVRVGFDKYDEEEDEEDEE